MSQRVVITGMGWITPMGHTIEGVWKRLLAGESGIDRTTIFDADTFPTRISAEVKEFALSKHVDTWESHAGAGRSTQFALAACAQAWAAANLADAKLDRDRVGIYFASGEGSLDFDAYTAAALSSFKAESSSIDAVKWAEVARLRMNVVREVEQEPNAALPHLAMLTGARGPAFNCLTACAASAQAIGEATEILRRGDADIMISGGAHSMIHPFGVTGFNRLTALSTANDEPRRASRPFDLHRGGFVLGEGSGVVVLETLDHALARKANILAEVAGYGSTADAYRITDQHPDGTGAVVAMTEALKDAQLTPADIGYIAAHGTGTRENDGNETSAIKQVFGDRAASVPISSLKSMMGHLIAAAGVANVISCVLAMRDGMLPPTMNRDTPDPECELDYVPNSARAAAVSACMSNSFGFGGQNDTVIVRKFAR
ncbi:MAG: beta-ketoacyl-[acyl-carrier-protein] synthase family protein [Tepidisphaeraceae bacterium]